MSESLQRIALGVVVHGGDVLIINRMKPESGSDTSMLSWAFPGGKIEDEETAARAAVREVKEETGIDVESVELITEGEHPYFPVFVSYIGCRALNSTILLRDVAIRNVL